MAQLDVSLSNYFLRAAVYKAGQQGHDVNNLLFRAGIPPKFLAQPLARVSADRYARLLTLAMRELKDEMLGYCVQPTPLGHWSALCHWLISSRNLYHALKRAGHFQGFVRTSFKLDVSVNAQHVLLHCEPWNPQDNIDPYGYELFLFCLHRQLCWLVSENIAIQAMDFPYPEPEHVNEYRVMFPGARVTFDASYCQVFFDRQERELPIRQTYESMAEFLKSPLFNIMVNDYSRLSWTERTQQTLQSHLELSPTLVDIAALLDVSPKILRRHLQREGTRYADVKAQLRRDIAIRLLTHSDESVESISRQTGFAECSTFTRAFRDWTGVAPFNYRKLMR